MISRTGKAFLAGAFFFRSLNMNQHLFLLLVISLCAAPVFAANDDTEIITIGPSVATPRQPTPATPARESPPAELSTLRTRAEAGNPDDQLTLGLALLDKRFGVDDPVEGAIWITKAASQNHFEARTVLGRLKRDGRGVPRNYFEAVRHFRAAADAGYQKARIELGMMYALGQGVHQDALEAYTLLCLASPTLQLAPANELHAERAMLAKLEKQLSTDQRELALERMNDARDQSLSELMKRHPGKQGLPPAPMTDPVKK
ncbi:MAG TPA: tetratricopeptide repeat protein [Candidatus Ozemobacteraceae bacterium]|nr:tetratricopeptide repeat protein [Candidatus Ozemobacteraceae bacterium]